MKKANLEKESKEEMILLLSHFSTFFFLKSLVQLEMMYYTIKMVGTYRCPECNGTEVTWDRGIGKAVCPNDRTLVDNYKVAPKAKK